MPVEVDRPHVISGNFNQNCFNKEMYFTLTGNEKFKRKRKIANHIYVSFTI